MNQYALEFLTVYLFDCNLLFIIIILSIDITKEVIYLLYPYFVYLTKHRQHKRGGNRFKAKYLRSNHNIPSSIAPFISNVGTY